jgi:hypothetical protein
MIYTIWQELHINLRGSHKRIPTLQLRMAEVDAVQFTAPKCAGTRHQL